MTFEEFFKKKRIDLIALQKGDAALFSEFKTHFEQMGEKSFDHTKKYWFNKLRHVYLLPAEIKTEKVKIDNPLAEQTITESLIESATPAPKSGFSPKFRTGIAKPVAPTEDAVKTEDKPTANKNDTVEPAITTAPKPGFTPRFKAGITKPAIPPDAVKAEDEPAENKIDTVGEQTIAPTTQPGFTPRFKAGITKAATPVEPNTEPQANTSAEDAPPLPPPDETPAPKPSYKPRFNMKNIPPKNQEE